MSGLDASIYDNPVLADLSKELAPATTRPLEVLLPRLLPLHPSGKRPFYEGAEEKGFKWVHGDFGNRAVGSFELRQWVERYPGCAWAVRTGEIPGGSGDPIGVIDIDDLGHPDVPQMPLGAWVRLTPNGMHIYIRLPHDVRTKVFEWGSFRGHNSYVQVSPERRAAADFGMVELGMLSEAMIEEFGLEPVEARRRIVTRERRRRPPGPPPPQVPQRPEDLPSELRNLVWRRPLTEGQVSVGRHGEVLGGRDDFLLYVLNVAAGHNRDLRGDRARLSGLAADYNDGLGEPLDSRQVQEKAARVATYSARWDEEGHTEAFKKRQRRKAYLSHEKRRQNGDHKRRNSRIVAGRARGISCRELARRHKLTERRVYQILAAAPAQVVWTRRPHKPMRRPRRPQQMVWRPAELEEPSGDGGRDPP